MSWHDDQEGLASRLREHGLAGLHEAQRLRRAAAARNESLSRWVVAGVVVLGSDGDQAFLTDATPRSAPRFDLQRDLVMGVPGVFEFVERMVETPGAVPGSATECTWCGRGWTLDTLHDLDLSLARAGDMRHETCARLRRWTHDYDQLRAVLMSAELPVDEVRAVPNEYWGAQGGPWLRVSLEGVTGWIRMGWRKNVISLDWRDTCLERDADVLFAEEKVTKGAGMIHACGTHKAVEYLRVLWSARQFRDGAS